MNFIKTKPLYTFFIAVFFCLHGSVENYGFISVKEVFEVFLCIFSAITFVFLIILFLSKSLSYSGFITFILSAVYLFFGVIKVYIFKIDILAHYIIFLPLMALVILLIVIFLKKNNPLSKTIFFLNLLLIIYCLLDVSSIIKNYTSNRENSSYGNIKINYKLVQNKPNVYFLLFDEYAGLQSLKDSFNYDNNKFYEGLKKDNFQVINSFSNYSITAFSMSSLFNMGYLKNLNDSSEVSWKETQKCMLDIKNAHAFNIFKNLGYDVKSFSLFEVLNNKSIGGNQLLLGHKRVLTHKMLHNVLLMDIGFNFTNGKYANSFIQKILLGDLAFYNTKVENGIFSTLKNDVNPKVVYAHFIMPHYPYLYDSAASKATMGKIFKDKSWLNKEDYISYLKYCNGKIIELEQKIIEKDSAAVVVLMSDHGFHYGNPSPSQSEFNNFCAVRNLSKNKATNPMFLSNVNFFRYLFNLNFSQSIPYLSDKRILLREK